MVTHNTSDIEKRIPTYVLTNTGNSVLVYGNGYYGESLPNLVFLRNKEYRFLFYNKNSIIDLFDKNGNLLRATDESNWDSPFVMRLGNNFPNEIHYKARYSQNEDFGVISLRDENKITGRVIAYGYCVGANVTDSNLYDVTTNENGIFSLYFENSGKTYYSVDYDLHSVGGFDSLLIDEKSQLTHQNMLKFRFKTKLGSLMLNSFTTLFYYLEKRYVSSDYKKINSMICNYFNLSSNYSILTDDPIQNYLTGKLELSNYTKLLLVTCMVEYIASQSNENLQEQFYEKLVNYILKGDKFNFMDIDFLELQNYEDYRTFKDVFYILNVRFQKLVTTQQKKKCVFEDALTLIFKYRNVIIKKSMSYDSFLKSELKLISGKIKIPNIPRSILLTFADPSKIASFGKYAKINVTDDLIKNVFNQPLPMEPEVVNQLLNKVLYIKQDSENFFCYKLTDFISFDYELPVINIEDVVQSFESESECCDHERFLRTTDLVKSQIELDEQEETYLFDFVLFNGDKIKMHQINFTNKNKPYEKINFYERFYVNEHISPKYRYTLPVFVGVSKEYSKYIQQIKMTFDGKILNYKAKRIRYDYDTIKINTKIVMDNIVSFETNHQHGYEAGDTITIKNSSKNGLLNGKHNIVSATDYSFTIEHTLPQNLSVDDISGTYGEIDSLRFSKIYCDTKDFTKGDILIFDKISNSNKFEVNSIKQDYLGGYLSVSGIVPKNSNVFTKKNTQTDEKEIIEYIYEPDAVYYNLDLDLEKYHLWVYNPKTPGDAANTRFNALISYVDTLPKVMETGSFQFNRNTLSPDVIYPTPTPSLDIIDDSTDPIDSTEEENAENFPSPVSVDDDKKEIDLIFDPSIPKTFPFETYPQITNNGIKFSPSEYEISISDPSLSGIKLTESYHFNRKYLRDEFDLKIENKNYDEIYDWDGDGIVGSNELKILERYILTKPETIEEYNENRGDYPIAKILPTIATATYACQDYCCHDDYTETDDFNVEDAYIYDAFQTYFDSLDQDTPTDFANFSYEYLVLVKQGLTPQLQNDIMYMPTDPRQSNLCADYTETGEVNSDDANIYYAYHLYRQVNNDVPDTMETFITYYDQLVASGIVPSLLNPIKILPSLQFEDQILSHDGFISKDCENISWKDLKIYNDWLRQDQPTDLEVFNQNRESDTPVACFLPQPGDQAPDFGDGVYDDIGDIGGPLFNKTFTGISNL